MLTLALGGLQACSSPDAAPLPAQSAAQATKPAVQAPKIAAATVAYGKRKASPEAIAQLGRTLFFDPSLSASGKLACASCHSPDHAMGPPNARAVQLGGADMRHQGLRAAPSLRYVQSVPPFSEHFFEDDDDDSVDAGPTGGHTWDGRARSTHEQAALPLLSPDEMGNADIAAVAARLARAPYAATLRSLFGDDVFATPQKAFDAATMALELFQETPALFYPYDSKYDEYLRGHVKLTPAEKRGLAVFNDEDKGNCASCHQSARTPSGAFPNFSDFGFVALGVPRNRALPANADPAFRDLGLCGPLRGDLKDRPEYCGLFRVPSLRNVSQRQSFFHNGVFHKLEDVLHFYAERDVRPEKWYPRQKGRLQKFDDLPTAAHANVNVDPPFGGRPGGRPAMSEANIRDLMAFLKTLDDGYAPAAKH
ncbi:cytochrome c peroxidase [Niveibacterium sp. SC-1]|uniref:cytochrome-c peroxidase n=1 Tax=Niveibacterium sp. SC-1 TaxID=3135646 RepID=UPI00311F26BC